MAAEVFRVGTDAERHPKTSSGDTSSSLRQNCCVVVCIVCFVLFYVLFVCKCVLPPGDNPVAVNKYVIYHIITLCIIYLPSFPSYFIIYEHIWHSSLHLQNY